MKAATTPSATEVHRLRRAGGSVDLASVLGLLAAALTRAADVPGRLADAAELRVRLEETRFELELRVLRMTRAVERAKARGRELDARRFDATIAALDEELEDVDAMLDEVERVQRRLAREVRTTEQRLAAFASLAAELPRGPERARLLDLVDGARRRLRQRIPHESSRPRPDYTFMRVEAKQTGHAR